MTTGFGDLHPILRAAPAGLLTWAMTAARLWSLLAVSMKLRRVGVAASADRFSARRGRAWVFGQVGEHVDLSTLSFLAGFAEMMVLAVALG